MTTLFTDEEILKIADEVYKPKVSAHLYTPTDYPQWLVVFARAIEQEIANRTPTK